MYKMFEVKDRLHVGGFTLLEWCGVAALLLGILWVLVKIRKRRFPVAPNVRTPLATGPLGGPPSARSKAKILVVDSDPTVLEMMQRRLGELGYHVVGVDSGEKAVAYMQKNGADLILLDLVVGEGLDGAGTYRKIRDVRPFQRVIVMSSHASPERVSAIRHLGVEHYLIKPVPIAILTQAIRTELDRP
jgi:CheY-like chemotaxis protein